MAKATGSKGNKKRRKGDQPKRKRYIAEKRGWRRRVRDLERHVKKHPGDKAASAAVPRVRLLLG